MLVPETPVVIGRTIVPDSMPLPLKIGQPIAEELGLNPRQVIPVTVESSGEKMSLSVNQKHIELPAHFQIKAGRYSAHITQSANGVVVQLVPKVANQAMMPVQSQATISPHLAMLMHRPLDKPTLLKLFTPGGLEKELLSLGLGKAAADVAGFRLDPRQLTGEGLRQFMLSIGLSSEAFLAAGRQVNSSHLKLWFRQLIRILPVNSGISGLLASALMDVEARQIDSLQHSQQKEFSFGFVLPFIDDEPVELDFYRSRGTESSPARWIINLHVVTEILGEIWLKSEIIDNSVNMTIWAKQQSTTDLLRSNIEELELELELLSFSLASFNVFNASRPESDSPGLRFPGDVVNQSA